MSPTNDDINMPLFASACVDPHLPPRRAAPAATSTHVDWPDWQSSSKPFAHVVATVKYQDTPTTRVELEREVAFSGNHAATTATSAMDSDAMQAGLSYESMSKRFMIPGETATSFIDIASFETWTHGAPPTKKTQHPAGKALLTDKRLLLLSCQPTTTSDIAVVGKPEKGHANGHLQLTYKAANSISYLPVPLLSFRSMSMKIETSSTSQTRVGKQAANLNGKLLLAGACLGGFGGLWLLLAAADADADAATIGALLVIAGLLLCSSSRWAWLRTCACCNDCLGNKWQSWTHDGAATSTADRYIQLDFVGVWDTKETMRIYLPPTVPIMSVQAWACELQGRIPNLTREDHNLSSVQVVRPSIP